MAVPSAGIKCADCWWPWISLILTMDYSWFFWYSLCGRSKRIVVAYRTEREKSSCPWVWCRPAVWRNQRRRWIPRHGVKTWLKNAGHAGLLSPSTCNRHHQSSHICWKISLELHVYLYLPLLLAGCGLNDFWAYMHPSPMSCADCWWPWISLILTMDYSWFFWYSLCGRSKIIVVAYRTETKKSSCPWVWCRPAVWRNQRRRWIPRHGVKTWLKNAGHAGLLSPSTCNRHHQSSHICWKISLELHVYLYLPLLLAGCGLNDFWAYMHPSPMSCADCWWLWISLILTMDYSWFFLYSLCGRPKIIAVAYRTETEKSSCPWVWCRPAVWRNQRRRWIPRHGVKTWLKNAGHAGMLSPSTCNRHHQSSHICWKISLELHVYLYLPLLLAGCGLNDFWSYMHPSPMSCADCWWPWISLILTMDYSWFFWYSLCGRSKIIVVTYRTETEKSSCPWVWCRPRVRAHRQKSPWRRWKRRQGVNLKKVPGMPACFLPVLAIGTIRVLTFVGKYL